MPLRKHQAELDELLGTLIDEGLPVSRVVMHVTPGGGKSLLPQIAYSRLAAAGIVDKLCWVVPRDSLQEQAAQDFLNPRSRKLAGHAFEIFEATNACDPSRGTAGYVTTYQAIGMDSARINASEFERYRYLLVLDEVHHVRDGGSWHRCLQPLVDRSEFTLLMTGTMERGDQAPIAFLPYREVSYV